jgi:hypothetical protein
VLGRKILLPPTSVLYDLNSGSDFIVDELISADENPTTPPNDTV